MPSESSTESAIFWDLEMAVLKDGEDARDPLQ